MTFEYLPGATPLDPDESAGLIPKHITLQSQLNEWEQRNILDAEKWMIGVIIYFAPKKARPSNELYISI